MDELFLVVYVNLCAWYVRFGCRRRHRRISLLVARRALARGGWRVWEKSRDWVIYKLGRS